MRDRVHWAREAAELSQRGLAKKAGIALRLISLIEAGGRDNPRLSTVRAIAARLEVSLDWLVNGVGEPPTKEAIRAALSKPARKRAA